jgi:membrane protein
VADRRARDIVAISRSRNSLAYYALIVRVDEAMWTLIKTSATNWMAHKDARMGAALAYYSIFSLGPIVLIAMAIAGLFFGRDAVQSEVSGAMKGLLGDNGAEAVQTMLTGASKPTEGLMAALIGVGTLMFAAVGVVVQLKDALNTVWEVEEPKEGGVWNFVRTYVLSLAAVIAVGFLLLVSLMLTAGIAVLGKLYANSIPEALLQPVGSAASFAGVALLFALIFKYLPDTAVNWRDVWLGALVTAFLFEIGKFAIGLYIGKQGLESSFGAAASLVVVLIWVYYSAQIMLMGAEFTRAHAHHNRGRG